MAIQEEENSSWNQSWTEQSHGLGEILWIKKLFKYEVNRMKISDQIVICIG